MNRNGAVVLTSPTGATLTLAGPGTDVLCAGPNVEVRDGVCEPKRNFTTTAEALQVVNADALQVVNTTLYSAIDTINALQARLTAVDGIAEANANLLTNGPLPQNFGINPINNAPNGDGSTEHAMLTPLGQVLAQSSCIGLATFSNKWLQAVQRQCKTDAPDCDAVCQSVGSTCYNSLHMGVQSAFFSAQDTKGLDVHVYGSALPASSNAPRTL